MVRAAKLQRRAERTSSGRFLAEGPNLVEAAARVGVVEEVFATESAAQRYRPMLAGLDVSVVTDRAMKTLSETVTPAGLVGVCSRPSADLGAILACTPGLIVIGDEISDPGNAGTLIRLADAMGAAAVVCRPLQRQVPAVLSGQHLLGSGAARVRHRWPDRPTARQRDSGAGHHPDR